MSVVRIPPVLRTEAGGAREVEAAGTTLREVIEDLSDRLPALGAHSFVNVYVDGEDVRLRSGLETPVRSDTTVILLPAMAGGRR
jgi:molybdopterin synthase sulfur carrier subunit